MRLLMVEHTHWIWIFDLDRVVVFIFTAAYDDKFVIRFQSKIYVAQSTIKYIEDIVCKHVKTFFV